MAPLLHTASVDPDRFTVREMIAEVQREIRMRRRVYDRRVRSGEMTRVEADRYIDLMTAVERRLTKTALVEV